MYDLIDYIDLVQESVNESDAEVLMAMAASYTKSLQIMESVTEDSDLYDSIFQEAEVPEGKPINAGELKQSTPKSTGEPVQGDPGAKTNNESSGGGKLRKTNFFVKALRFIKRLWQQIITMVSSHMTKNSIKKAKKAIGKANGDNVKSHYSEYQIKYLTSVLEELTTICSDGLKKFNNLDSLKSSQIESLLDVITHITSTEKRYKKLELRAKKLKLTETSSKEVLNKYFDKFIDMIGPMRDIAKRVDKIVDKMISDMSKDERASFEISRSSDEITKLNNASSDLFKFIRELCSICRMITSVYVKEDNLTNVAKDEKGDVISLGYDKDKSAAEEDKITEFATVMENYEVTHWSAYFMEGAENGELRSKNFVAKTIRFIKRLWQQIITMVSSQLMNHTVKKTIKKLKESSETYVKCPYPNNQLDSWISNYSNDADKYEKIVKDIEGKSGDSMKSDDWNKLVRELVTDLTNEIKPSMENSEGENIPEAKASVAKEKLIKALETVQKWVPAITSMAKMIDKIIDKSTLTKSDITSSYAGYTDAEMDTLINDLNKMSSTMFKYVRLNCSFVRDICKPILGELKNGASSENKADSTAAEPAAATA